MVMAKTVNRPNTIMSEIASQVRAMPFSSTGVGMPRHPIVVAGGRLKRAQASNASVRPRPDVTEKPRNFGANCRRPGQASTKFVTSACLGNSAAGGAFSAER